MSEKIYIENLVDPPYPKAFDQYTTETMCFKNCIFNYETEFVCEDVYFTRVYFKSCIFNGPVRLVATCFQNGFVFDNCIFNAERYTTMSNLSANEATIEITNNIFLGFFYFYDNFPDAPIIIKNNIFKGDSNLLAAKGMSLDVREVDCVENNLGKLDIIYHAGIPGEGII